MVLSDRAHRLRPLPWVVLFAALALTIGIAGIRIKAVADSREGALDAADRHFRDVVADNESRASGASQDYERILVGAIFGLDSPVSPVEVEQRLEVMAADELSGSLAFLIAPVGADPIWIGNTSEAEARINDAGQSRTGLWIGPVENDAELVVVGFTTAKGDTVAALVSPTSLLTLPGQTETHRHNVTVTLAPLQMPENSPILITGEPMAMAMADEADTTHHNDDHPQPEPTQVTLTSTSEVMMFGGLWGLNVVAGEDFLTIPSSREVVVLIGLGLLLSLSLFGLIHFLVRRVAAESHRRVAEERFAAGFNSSPIGFAVLDAEGRIADVNRAFEHLMNRSADCLSGIPMVELVAEPFKAQWTARVLRPGSESTRPQAEVRYEPEPDRRVWVNESFTSVIDSSGKRHILLQMTDVTEQRDNREELQRRALHDSLTGLANRTLLEDRLNKPSAAPNATEARPLSCSLTLTSSR